MTLSYYMTKLKTVEVVDLTRYIVAEPAVACKRLYCKSGFLNDIFWMFLLSDMDECVIDIFRPLPVIINDVYKSFLIESV